tara:strand:- start:2550 stop:3161 length:612 start_codon:yes stop_codon:yes gene_type:complete
MSDYNYYIRLIADSLITYAYVLPHKQEKKEVNDVLYKANQSKDWELPRDIHNIYNEYKWLYISHSEDLQEQTEPTQEFIKNKLLADLEVYYQDCKNINITIGDKTITHKFDSKWRNLLHTKISSLKIADKLNKPENIFTWLVNGVAVILTIENLEHLLYAVEQEITQPNYNNFLEETAYIKTNNVTLDYDYKKNFLQNQVINL